VIYDAMLVRWNKDYGVKVAVFWVAVPSLVKAYHHFRGTCAASNIITLKMETTSLRTLVENNLFRNLSTRFQM
jgi:hypothetical protein